MWSMSLPNLITIITLPFEKLLKCFVYLEVGTGSFKMEKEHQDIFSVSECNNDLWACMGVIQHAFEKSAPQVCPNTNNTGGRLNKKDGLTRYGDSHVKDKTS